jgi:peroxiredoxin
MVLGETPADKLGSAPTRLGLKVGSKAPDAKLTDVSGKVETLSALYHEGPTFVVFYRGGWCPFCNMQLHALTTAKPDFDKKGLRIVAISVDKPEEEAKTQAKQGVPFPMLSDSDLATHKAFNVVHVPAEAEAKALAGYGIDLEKYSGKAHHSFAVPAIFLVDRTGVVRWEHVDEDYKTRPSTKQMLEVADRVLAK